MQIPKFPVWYYDENGTPTHIKVDKDQFGPLMRQAILLKNLLINHMENDQKCVVVLTKNGITNQKAWDALVDYLRSRHNAEGLHEWAQPTLAVGERARVVGGPLAGYEGILIARSSRERVVILMDLVGGQVRAKLNPDQIEPVAR